MLHSLEFLVHFAKVFCTCFNFHRVFFRAWIYSTSTEQHMDLRCIRNSLSVQWNGMPRNSRSHLAVQHQPLLNWIRCCWRGHNENWSLHTIPTVLIQTSEASTTTFKDDALEVTVILYWMNSACVKLRKFTMVKAQEILFWFWV